MRQLIAAIAFVALVGAPVLAQDEEKKPAKESSLDDKSIKMMVGDAPLEVSALLQPWASVLGTEFSVDPQLVGTKIKLRSGESTLTWGIAKAILEANDIVIEAKEVEGKWVMFAHARRNLPARVGPVTRVVGEGEKAPRREEVITAIFNVKNGGGNDIYATMRGLLTRDINRIGNMLYVRGPEVLIFCDFASNVEYYASVLKKLDIPAPRPVIRLYKLKHANASDTVGLIYKLLIDAPGADKKAVVGTAPLFERKVIADERTNQLIVTAFEDEHAELAKVIAGLDAQVEPKAK
jgi:type II secretory pathway component GspD/PulD (secretin)